MIKDLDEAIQHCLEVADQKETKAKYCFKTPWESDDTAKDCIKCAEEHRQLAEWLMDYKRLKEERGFLIRNEYRRGWHDALCKALRESYHVQCEGEDFEVVQVKTLNGLGMSKLCALGKQPEELEGEI
jgi:hypothetical protein